MKKVISLFLALAMLISVVTVSFTALSVSDKDELTDEIFVKSVADAVKEAEVDPADTQRIYFQMADGKRGFAATDDHTVFIEEKDDEGTVIGGHDEVYIHAGEKVKNLYNDYNLVGDKHYAGIYWWGGSAVPEGWVGYRMEIEDYEQGIYYADVPRDVPVVIFNNGVDAGSDLALAEYAAQSKNTNVEGVYEDELTTMPEGSPDDGESFDGCIYIINPDAVGVNDLSGAPEFGDDDPWWFYYYGNGCYGSYSQDSDNFVSIEENCKNPDHFVNGVHVGYHSDEEPTQPAHVHTPGDAVKENMVPASFEAPGSYDEVVYCTECNEEISRTSKTIAQLVPDSNLLYFDAGKSGWEVTAKSKVGFYIYSLTTGEDDTLPWGSKKLNGTAVNDAEGNFTGVFSYDPAAKGMNLKDSEQYAIIFTLGSTETYSLLMDTTCLGHIGYADTENKVENPVDSSKQSILAFWEGLDPAQYGPRLQITSTGNVVGTCIPAGETGEGIFNTFLTETGTQGLVNAREYTTKTEQQMIDDIGTALSLTKQQVYDAFAAAGVETPWDYTLSTLPGDVVIPTEPATEPVVPTEPVTEPVVPTEPVTEPPHVHTPGEPVQENRTVTHDKTTYDEVVYCTDCHEEISRTPVELPIITHTLSYVAEVPATYDAEGTQAHYACSGCDKLFADATGLVEVTAESLVIPKLVRPTEPVTEPVVITGIRGDIDDSGEVDIVDVTVLQRCLVDIITPDAGMIARGDVDGNGDLESIDATYIQRFLVNINPYKIGQSL